MKMHLVKRNQNVKVWNNKGFTMLEMLFSFSVFCLVASFLPLMFHILFDYQSIDGRIQRMEWELFISQLKKEVQSSDSVVVVDGELTMINEEEEEEEEEAVSIQQYQKILRRQVNGNGHEVVLQNVNKVFFEKDGNAITIQVQNTFNQTNKATIYLFISPDEILITEGG